MAGPKATGAAITSPAPVPTSSPARRPDYPVRRENRRRGTTGWLLGLGGPVPAEGYTSRTSVAPGESFSLHVGADGAPVDVSWYRLGWYGGTGARLLRVDRGVATVPRLRPAPDSATGLVEAGWDPSVQLKVDPSWVSGMHVAALTGPAGGVGYVPFVVRPSVDPSAPNGRAPILFVHAAMTYQAYNGWGGKSLYSYNSYGARMPSGTRAAVTVGFDRPYDRARGAGFLFNWELQFIRWQERMGRDVEYVADVDLALHPEVFQGRRLIVFAGHHEYWSRPMRSTLAGLIASGTNVAFLSANEIYWQVRLGDAPSGSSRRITCYKSASRDPLTKTDPTLATCRWREAPVSDPEAAIIGQMYGHVVRTPGPWVVRNAGHWLYAGTGLRDGDRIQRLVGQEYDTFFPKLAPPGTILLARGRVEAVGTDPDGSGNVQSPPIHTATMYTADSGATVFAAGTFQWSWALDDFGARAWRGYVTPLDRRVGIMTSNLFDRLGDGPAA
ncbi:MAG: hypothetical protein IVW53_06005 [Chloroflexi bacterium]|nr:hypothetical protein [Chloroflexota bacterium]